MGHVGMDAYQPKCMQTESISQAPEKLFYLLSDFQSIHDSYYKLSQYTVHLNIITIYSLKYRFEV